MTAIAKIFYVDKFSRLMYNFHHELLIGKWSPCAYSEIVKSRKVGDRD